jgi:non-heme chloroperoxidase
MIVSPNAVRQFVCLGILLLCQIKQLCLKFRAMKKLLLISSLFLVFSSNAQLLEGVNQEHLGNWVSGKVLEEKFSVKRATLKTGVSLEYVEQGKPGGITVILLHGLSDSWHSFETVLPHLPESIHVFAISQRGHGDSERPAENYSPKHFAADVAAFIEQQNLGAVVIVGHSMGGVHAQRFAIDYPQLTKAIVIIGSDAEIVKNPGISEFLDVVMKLEDPISKEFMEEFQKSTIVRPVDSAFFKLVVNESMKLPARVFKSVLNELLQHKITSQELNSINKPTLILWGDKDAIFFHQGQDALKRNIKNSKLIVYEGTGHAVHWEEPARFAKDLAQFIQSINKQ